ncbi:MAG TPA: glycoside hydrolase family 15 protein [Bacteriovoracaceae bacterium]|nr:glycoside hydrolase family 15 protein [Bacteriovoracaceae bacterium]
MGNKNNMQEFDQYRMGIIGNCSFLANIDAHGSICWLCWPHVDDRPIFNSLLNEVGGAKFQIRPAGNFLTSQHYLRNTNILVTEFKSDDGAFRVIDFAPRFKLFDRNHRPLSIFRKIERIFGNPQVVISIDLARRNGVDLILPILGSNHLTYRADDIDIRLTTNVSKSNILEELPFTLTEDKYLVLTWGEHLQASLEETFNDFFARTENYWHDWIRRTTLPCIYQKELIRSALILKLHQDEDSGAVIASGNTSLPEFPGSGRNWDYRFSWIRDSYFTLSALHSLGHFSEIERYSHFIQDIAIKAKDRIHPVYKINGSPPIPEIVDLHLQGYKSNGPVRFGNEAYNQIQNDVYGQILLSLLPLYSDQRVDDRSPRPSKKLVMSLLEKIERTLLEKDAGIWEFRGKTMANCTTSLFRWAGARAALKISQIIFDDDMHIRAHELLYKSKEAIEECYSRAENCFYAASDVKFFDASTLLLINMSYLDKVTDKQRAIGHLRRIEQELSAQEGLFFRYRENDDFGETKAAFLICSFWFIEALATLGFVDEAIKKLEKVIGYSNSLGIFSEDIDPTTKGQLGNFGQTYGHVGLINAVFRIAKKVDGNIFD